MKGTILEKIFEAKRLRLATKMRETSFSELKDTAAERRSATKPHRLRTALSDRSRTNIIAEFKRASPSKGVINNSVEPAPAAQSYKDGGAAAISVLTEEDFFKGSLEDLRAIREAVDLPILRKDFIFDPYQIFESAAAGANAILLIAAMLDDDTLSELRELAENESGLDTLVEVHTIDELERVKNIGATLIGVNNRDLRTFNVTLDVSRMLIQNAPDGTIMVAESGLRTRSDLIELHAIGYSGFLIGETLMRSGNPTETLRDLIENI